MPCDKVDQHCFCDRQWAVNRLYLHNLINDLSDKDVVIVCITAEILIKARKSDFIGLFSSEDLSRIETE